MHHLFTVSLPYTTDISIIYSFTFFRIFLLVAQARILLRTMPIKSPTGMTQLP